MSIGIGARVKQVRGVLNQRDFAESLGVSKGSISQIEQDKAMPSGEFLLKIKTVMAVDLNWLLTGMGNEPQPMQSDLKPDEIALLDNYRHASKEQQEILRATSAVFANKPTATKASKDVKIGGKGHRFALGDYHENK